MTNPIILGSRPDVDLTVCLDPLWGFGRLKPMPSDAEIEALYRGPFWASKGDEQAVRERQAPWWDAHYGDWIGLLRKHEDRRGQFTLLDVGCGFGWFARAALMRSFNVHAIDPNLDACEAASSRLRGLFPGHNLVTDIVTTKTQDGERTVGVRGRIDGLFEYGVHPGDLDEVARKQKLLPESYDVISALWVLEHLAYPSLFMDDVIRLLRPGGLFLAAVPNDFNNYQIQACRSGLTRRPNWWIDPTHLNYWTPATFANFLGRWGLRVVEQTTMYQMERWIFDGYDYPADPAIGPELHGRVRAHDLAMSAPERVRHYQDQAMVGLGREIIVVAMKE